jgi:hypothetical protein
LVPSVVPAPGRFSMMTLWPIVVDICWAISRPNTSGAEPALNGEMILIGLFG